MTCESACGWADLIFSRVREAIPKKCPLVRLATTITQHCEDNVAPAVPPAPSTSRFISQAELQALGQNPICESLEETLREKVRGKYERYMQTKISQNQSRSYCVMLEIQMMRLAFNKSMHAKLPGGVAGRYTDEKLVTLIRNWASWVETECDDLRGMAAALGLLADADEEDEVSVLIRSHCICVLS